MKNLQFDFLVDKNAKTVTVVKQFTAIKQTVWNCFTQAELLDKWWAPLPYKNETLTMDFSEGGCWHYAMISSEGQKHYCKAKYKKISTLKAYTYQDAFCNEQGEENNEMPSMHWNISFNEKENDTVVNVVLNFETEEALESIIKMGFKEGFTIGILQLEKLLSTL